MPGPGAYISSQYSNTGVELSLGKSRKIDQPNNVPGPGAYNPKKEKVQKRPQTAKIGNSKRFFKINTESSPQFYETKVSPKTPDYSFTRDKKL